MRADSPFAMWWLACLALLAVLVAGAGGYLLGQALARQRLERALFALRVQQQALVQLVGECAQAPGAQPDSPAQPLLCWRSDALNQLVQCSGPGVRFDLVSAPAQQPAWFVQPALQQSLATGQAVAGLQVFCGTTPALSDPAGNATAAPTTAATAAQPHTWLVRAHPLLDHAGRFGGYMGTAQALAPVLPASFPAAAEAASNAGAASAAAETQAAAAVQATNAEASNGAESAARDAVRDAEEADSFSFTVSHDLRAPIRVVEGFTRIVKEDYGQLLDRVGNDHLDRVLGAAARMNLMIDALLTLARLSKQPLARQPVNLSQIARYVVDELRRAHPDREVGVDIEDGLQAEGDPTLLRLVLENLLGNAWKYSARNPQAQLSLRSVPHGSGRAFVVRDNGAGFDMRSAERLFGLFQRLHSASEFPGHGVGLASVRRIVRRHGGDIWAEGEPARGAAFTFTLHGS